ncbi:MAG: hypothetical protein OXD42_02700 [Rhodospirillaceae bacterium]|nr:hypothetical protein [Rhodospirillaceae bacterium]
MKGMASLFDEVEELFPYPARSWKQPPPYLSERKRILHGKERPLPRLAESFALPFGGTRAAAYDC